MAATAGHRAGTPDPPADRGRRRRRGGREGGGRRPAWTTSAPGLRRRAASSTTTSTTRPTCCGPWPRPPTTPSSTASRTLFAGLGTWAGFQRWADALVELQAAARRRGGCPIANLVAQLGEHDEPPAPCSLSGSTAGKHTSAPVSPPWSAPASFGPDADVDWLAASTLASVQGGLMLTQARRDPRALRRALDGALALIDTYRATRRRAELSGHLAHRRRGLEKEHFLGGRDRRRSGDLALFRRALCQLSYPTVRASPCSADEPWRRVRLADLTGFEPATSGLTGRRALRAAPQVLGLPGPSADRSRSTTTDRRPRGRSSPRDARRSGGRSVYAPRSGWQRGHQ